MNKAMPSIRFLAAMLVFIGGAFARTTVVDNRHADADDENPGTQEAPRRTIHAASQIAEAGDTVLVRPGSYRESVPVNIRGIGIFREHRVNGPS